MTFCIDKLWIGIEIDDYCSKFSLLLSQLEELKPEAKHREIYITIGKVKFRVLPNCRPGYIYGIECQDFKMFLTSCFGDSSFPIHLEISPQFLWTRGYTQAWEDIRSWFESIDYLVLLTRVSRVDLSTHCYTMVVEPGDHIKLFTSRSRGRAEHIYNGEVTGIEFGKGSIHSVIYNKSHLIKQKSDGYWFEDIWRETGWDGDSDVWNIEFQLKSSYLRKQELVTIEQVFDKLPQLWRYLTTFWLSMREPDNHRSNRRTINPLWDQISKVNIPSYCGNTKHVTTNSMAKVDFLINSICGSLISLARHQNITNDMQLTFTVIRHLRAYLRRKQLSLQQLIATKIGSINP